MTAPPAMTRSRLAALTVAAAGALLVLLGLGTWQIQRLAWKTDLIARVEARLASAPEPIPPPSTWSALTPEEIEYRPVRLTGRFAPAVEFHVQIALTQPKGPRGGIGYFVLAPLTLDDGRIVIVNRGFVPAEAKDPSTRPAIPDGQATVEGLMRPTEQRSWVAPADDPAKNVWFVRDPKVMAAAAGLDPDAVAPFTVDAFAGPPGSLPQGGETIVAFTNNHLGYAITWYGLAAALIAVYASLVFRQG